MAGGAVRNALLGKPVQDVDLATTLTPTDVMQLARGAGFGVHATGLEHGTITVVNRAAAFEVTTLRRDVETDGRHAVVAFTNNFAEDAGRRDFTINALYCSREGKIYDFTDGYSDILKRRVRFVGKPDARIEEDYLRILRFFRFQAAYGKGEPDRLGLAACKRHRAGLGKISAERIRQELMKLLVAPRATETLKVMAETGILKVVLPASEQWRVIKRLPPDSVLRLFVLSREPKGLKELLRLSNVEADRIDALTKAPHVYPNIKEQKQRALFYKLGPHPQHWGDAVHLSFAKSRATKNDRRWKKLLTLPDRWPRPAFPLSGKDLIEQGFASGPELGTVLQKAEKRWIESDFVMSPQDLLAFTESQKHAT